MWPSALMARLIDIDIAPLCETTAIGLGANSCNVSSGIVANPDFPEPTPMQLADSGHAAVVQARNSRKTGPVGPPPSPKPAA